MTRWEKAGLALFLSDAVLSAGLHAHYGLALPKDVLSDVHVVISAVLGITGMIVFIAAKR